MLGHLGLNVPDLDEASRYYNEILPLLGYEPFFATEDEFSFKPSGDRRGTYLFFYRASQPGAYSRHQVGLQHLAFAVRSRAAVREIHARIVALGDEVVHPPRAFPEYPPPYYATFWLDPFGFMLEAVCHHDRD